MIMRMSENAKNVRVDFEPESFAPIQNGMQLRFPLGGGWSAEDPT